MLTAARLHVHALTHQGHVRSRNEDAHAGCPDGGFAVLADGMGGGQAGDVAAQLAVATVVRELRTALDDDPTLCGSDLDESGLIALERAIRRAAAQANAAVHARSHSEPGCAGMGSTLLVAVWRGGDLIVGHVGDSRAYRLRRRKWPLPAGGTHSVVESSRLTRDHNHGRSRWEGWPRLQPRAETLGGDTDHLLTRAIGVESDVVLELHRHRLQAGDIVMLCSDGLTDGVDDTRIERISAAVLEAHPEPGTAPPLAGLAQALVDAALMAGGRDNITVILGSGPVERAEAT